MEDYYTGTKNMRDRTFHEILLGYEIPNAEYQQHFDEWENWIETGVVPEYWMDNLDGFDDDMEYFIEVLGGFPSGEQSADESEAGEPPTPEESVASADIAGPSNPGALYHSGFTSSFSRQPSTPSLTN
jgi:hypothetical protein